MCRETCHETCQKRVRTRSVAVHRIASVATHVLNHVGLFSLILQYSGSPVEYVQTADEAASRGWNFYTHWAELNLSKPEPESEPESEPKILPSYKVLERAITTKDAELLQIWCAYRTPRAILDYMSHAAHFHDLGDVYEILLKLPVVYMYLKKLTGLQEPYGEDEEIKLIQHVDTLAEKYQVRALEQLLNNRNVEILESFYIYAVELFIRFVKETSPGGNVSPQQLATFKVLCKFLPRGPNITIWILLTPEYVVFVDMLAAVGYPAPAWWHLLPVLERARRSL